MTASHSWGSISISGLHIWIAALLMSASRLSVFPLNRSNSSSTESGRDTSASKTSTSFEELVGALRSTAITSQPAAWKASTVARPMPLAAPVTSTFFFIEILHRKERVRHDHSIRGLGRGRLNAKPGKQVPNGIPMYPLPGRRAAVGVVRSQQDIVHASEFAVRR